MVTRLPAAVTTFAPLITVVRVCLILADQVLEPASVAVPTSAADEQDNYDDDQKSGRVHTVLPLPHRVAIRLSLDSSSQEFL